MKRRILIALIYLFGLSNFAYNQNGLVAGMNLLQDSGDKTDAPVFEASAGYKWWFASPAILYAQNITNKENRVHSLGLRLDIYFQKKPWIVRPFGRIEITTQVAAYKSGKAVMSDDNMTYRDDPFVFNPYGGHAENLEIIFAKQNFSFAALAGMEFRFKNTLFQLGIGVRNLSYTYDVRDYFPMGTSYTVSKNHTLDLKDNLTLQVGISQVIPFKSKQH